MTAVYFDTSALMKIIVAEDGTPAAKTLWQRASERVVSYLAWPETHSALAGALRSRRLTEEGRKRGAHLLNRRFERCVTVGVHERYLQHAADLVDVFDLSAADAIHLATATTIMPPDAVFATWDKRLHKAAARAGMVVAPASL